MSLVFSAGYSLGQSYAFGEKPLKLDKLDFGMDVKKFYPVRYEWPEFKDYYWIPVGKSKDELSVVKNTEPEFSDEPQWIAYYQKNSCNDHKLASIGGFTFCKLQLITTLQDKLMLVCAYSGEIVPQELLVYLEKRYGVHETKQHISFGKEYDVYTWDASDRLIKYAVGENSDRGVLGLNIDQESKTIEQFEPEKHYESRIFIIKKEHAATLVGNMNTEDFIYCK